MKRKMNLKTKLGVAMMIFVVGFVGCASDENMENKSIQNSEVLQETADIQSGKNVYSEVVETSDSLDEGNIDTYYTNSNGVSISEIKGLSDIRTKEVGETCDVSVEYKETSEADYCMYLSITLVQEADGWKIQFYAVEG